MSVNLLFVYLIYCKLCFSSVESLSPVVSQLTKPLLLAEGPFYDDLEEKLYFVDIDGKSLHRLDPITLEEQVLFFDRVISFVIPVKDKDNQYIVSLGRDLELLTWDYNSGLYNTCRIVTVDKDHPDNRWNEAKADIYGNIWAGTKGPEDENNESPPNQGTLYRIDATQPGKASTKVVLRPVSISNGLVWSLDNRFLYYIDTPTKKVDVFNCDLVNGRISKRRVLFDFEDFNIQGIPDGLQIDSDGNLWVTANGAGQVLKINPHTGKILQKVDIPVKHVTSVEFGGPNLDILFVTTMKSKTIGVPPEPQEGAVFTVTGLGVTGLPSKRAVVNSSCYT